MEDTEGEEAPMYPLYLSLARSISGDTKGGAEMGRDTFHASSDLW